MKKLILVFVLVSVLVNCSKKQELKLDSSVDSLKTDSLKVDTMKVKIDSLKTDSVK